VAPPVVVACTHPPVEIKNSHISFLPHLQKKSIKKQIKRHKKREGIEKNSRDKRKRKRKKEGAKERV
jgi:hypothetical protein